MAKTIYDYWFTQFDYPDENGNSYKSSGGKMIYNNLLKCKIPENWSIKKFSDVCKILLGGTPDTSNNGYWNGSYNWLNSGEISQFPVVSSELKITKLGIDNSSTKLMPVNTVVVSITGNIRASILAIDTCANQSVVGILENKSMKSSYIYPTVCKLLNYYTAISTGNCQKHINKGTIEDSYILIPDGATLTQYYKTVHRIYETINNNALENKQLSNLRDWLLPMLMNGQATISN
jgi:type I restriction enzyme S subunit